MNELLDVTENQNPQPDLRNGFSIFSLGLGTVPTPPPKGKTRICSGAGIPSPVEHRDHFNPCAGAKKRAPQISLPVELHKSRPLVPDTLPPAERFSLAAALNLPASSYIAPLAEVETAAIPAAGR